MQHYLDPYNHYHGFHLLPLKLVLVLTEAYKNEGSTFVLYKLRHFQIMNWSNLLVLFKKQTVCY